MPLPFHALVPCGACGCHVRLTEKECPYCGALIRGPDGALPRTNIAVLMGLTAALLQPIACGGDSEPPDTGQGTGGDISVGSAYGVGPSTSTGGGAGADDGGGRSVGGNGGNGGQGMGGDINVGSAYGVGPSTSTGGSGGAGGGGAGGVADGGGQ
jgi:hypothetical protein